MSGQGDDIQCHINVEGQLINRWTLTYRNDTGLFDKKLKNDTPVTFPSSEKTLRVRIKELADEAQMSP